MIEVFVGCSANGEDAESLMVLEYSMKKHTDREVNITHMMLGSDETWSNWNTQTWATPFSGFRWTIPEHMGFKGQGIYMDSDMIILSDIGELWDQEFQPGKVVLAKGSKGGEGWRYCVCKWNNETAAEYIFPLNRMKQLPQSHQRMMALFASNQNIVQPFEGNWNCIDGENLPIDEMDILHYSDMSTQMHLKYAMPRLSENNQHHWFDGNIREHWRKDLVDLFEQYYKEALDSGYKVEDYIPENMFGEYSKESQANYDRYRNQWSQR